MQKLKSPGKEFSFRASGREQPANTRLSLCETVFGLQTFRTVREQFVLFLVTKFDDFFLALTRKLLTLYRYY